MKDSLAEQIENGLFNGDLDWCGSPDELTETDLHNLIQAAAEMKPAASRAIVRAYPEQAAAFFREASDGKEFSDFTDHDLIVNYETDYGDGSISAACRQFVAPDVIDTAVWKANAMAYADGYFMG